MQWVNEASVTSIKEQQEQAVKISKSEETEKAFTNDIRTCKKRFLIYIEKQREKDHKGYWFISKLKGGVISK